MAQLPRGATEPHDLRRAANVAIALLVVGMVVDVVAIVFDVLERGVLQDFLAGPGDIAAVSASDGRQQVARVAQLLVLLLGAGAFIHWFWKAYRNLEELGVDRADLRHRRGWAIAAWFVPIVNFFWPKQIANDIWRASDPRVGPVEWPARSVSPLLHWWWAACCCPGFCRAGQIACRMAPRSISDRRRPYWMR